MTANPHFRFTAKLWRGFTHERNATAEDEKLVKTAMNPLVEGVNRATAFQGVYAWFYSSFALSIASSSGSVNILSFGSGCFGAGRLAIRKSRKCFVAARRA